MLDELLCEAKLADLERAIQAELAKSIAYRNDLPGPTGRVERRRPAAGWWRFGVRTAATEASES